MKTFKTYTMKNFLNKLDNILEVAPYVIMLTALFGMLICDLFNINF